MTQQLALDIFLSANPKPPEVEIVKRIPILTDRKRLFLVPPATGRDILIRRGKTQAPELMKPEHAPSAPICTLLPTSQHPLDTIRLVTRKMEELYTITHDWGSFRDGLNLMEATLNRFQPGAEERYMENVKRLGPKGSNKAAEFLPSC